jgi:hypothetical protein
VPTSQEFLDIVLSRTQRQLPTQIRAGFKIARIRGTVTVSFFFLYIPVAVLRVATSIQEKKNLSGLSIKHDR